jgi:hypothetical protein
MDLVKWSLSVGLFIILIASTSIAANEVSRDDWTNRLATAFPVYVCQANQYFRQCFNVTQTECEETALSAIRTCLAQNKDKIPTRISLPEEGTRLGTVIGACAGTAYEAVLQKKRISNSKCNNPENWK